MVVLGGALGGVLLIEGLLQVLKNKDGWDITREAHILRDFQFEYKVKSYNRANPPIVDYVPDEYGLRDDCSGTEKIKF